MKLQNKIFLSFLLSFMVLQVTCKSFFRKDLQKFDNTIQGFEQFDLYTKRNFLGYVKDKNGFSPGMVYEGMVKKDKPEGIFKKKYDSRTKLGASARVQGMFSFGTKLDLIEEVEIELINPRVETLENPKILNSFANDENMKKMKYISSVMYADEVKVKLKTQKGVDFDAKAYLNQQLPGLQVGVENSIQKGEEEFTFWKDVYIGYQLRSYDGKFVPSESETKMKVVVLPFESNNKEKEEYQTFLQMATVSVLHELQVSVQERSSKQKELESKYMEDISIVNELSANTLLSGKLYFAGNKAKIYCDLKDKYGEVIQGSHIDYTINLEGKDVFVVEEEWKKLLLEKYNFLAPETKNVETKPSNFATSNEEAYISYIKGNEKYLEMSEKSLEESETLLKKAIELDPKFYKAHALLSEVYSSRYYLYHVYNESSYEKYKSLSKEAAQKSLALAANEYKPNRAMALYYDLIEENSKESKKYFEKVLKV
ncbi:MAG: hypothetical protein KDK45_12250, partial [Leptospiraceae bacterium]|nr:hypothetical protein [Leptospiraceae bacterium]